MMREDPVQSTGNVMNSMMQASETSETCGRVGDGKPPCRSDGSLQSLVRQSEEILRSIDLAQGETRECIEKQIQGSDVPQERIDGNREALRNVRTKLGIATYRIYNLEDEVDSVTRELQRRGKKRRLFPAPPANAEVDWLESSQRGFATGLNFYKQFSVFFLGSFFGVIVEMLYCLLQNGYIASRAGVVYGPLNPLYGIGALLVTRFLYGLRNRNSVLIFLGGAFVTTVVEYVASWGQEFVYGTRSWGYGNLPFNINGRVTLLYSFFWGVLSVVWIKNLYPRMSKALLRVPPKIGKYVTHGLLLFMIVNCAVSAVALNRWAQRNHGQPAYSSIAAFFDEHFPDERMERIYENMSFINDSPPGEQPAKEPSGSAQSSKEPSAKEHSPKN